MVRIFKACQRSVRHGCKKKGMRQMFKAACGKQYAVAQMAQRHDQQYHSGGD